jgi:hypothetical protein
VIQSERTIGRRVHQNSSGLGSFPRCAGVASLSQLTAIWRGTSVRLHRGENISHRDAGQARTTMLSVAAHLGQAKVRKSKPSLSDSRQERIIGASQSAQNGRSLVALPWKNEGTERLSITLPLGWGGGASLPVTDSCRDGVVITQQDVSGRGLLVNIAHSRRFKASTN